MTVIPNFWYNRNFIFYLLSLIARKCESSKNKSQDIVKIYPETKFNQIGLIVWVVENCTYDRQRDIITKNMSLGAAFYTKLKPIFRKSERWVLVSWQPISNFKLKLLRLVTLSTTFWTFLHPTIFPICF